MCFIIKMQIKEVFCFVGHIAIQFFIFANFDVEITDSLDYNSVLVFKIIVLRGNELNVICVDNRFLKVCSELSVDGMNDIAVCAVGILSRGHNDEESFTGINNLYVVNCKAIVERNRHNCLHRSLVKKFSDFDVCDLHG